LTSELNITISGICTNVFGVVPGVNMRTVVPDATAIRFGVVRIPESPGKYTNAYYYLMPHVGMMRDQVVGARNRWFLTGYYIRVVNAIDQPFSYSGEGFQLTEFADHVSISPQVVLEGGALAYLDVVGGRVRTEGIKHDDPLICHICIKTSGTPRISITPLPGTVLPQWGEIVIDSHELHITNLDYEAVTEDANFDFLMNYLVTSNGIPKSLTRLTPGMPAENKKLTLRHLGERLRALGLLMETGGTVEGWRKSIEFGDEPQSLEPLEPPSHGGSAVSIGTAEEVMSMLGTTVLDPVPFDPSCSFGDMGGGA